jgi:hypothetical protein
MYNLRYHLASLIAVFLALTVGLVLGTVITERGIITDQSSALVEDLQRQFGDLRAENSALRTESDRDSAFASAVVPHLIAGSLEGSSTAIVTGAGRIDGQDAVRSAVEAAGSDVVSIVVTREAAGLGEDVPEGLDGLLAAAGETPAGPGPDLIGQVAVVLSREWREPGVRPLTTLLADAGLILVEGLDEGRAITGMVVMPSAGNSCDPLALALAGEARAQGDAAVAAESTAGGASAVGACAEQGMSAVDHVDTPQGAFSLVWLLAERASGYYGAGEGAEAYFPPMTRGD